MRVKPRNLVVIAFAIIFGVGVFINLSLSMRVTQNTAGAITLDMPSNKEQQATATDTNHTVKEQVCSPMPTNSKTVPKPIWVPAFPGSGSTVMRKLVNAITGQRANEIYSGSSMQGGPGACNAGNVVTCKTHWPVYTNPSPEEFKSQFYSSAIILVRNPAKALPSFANYGWEQGRATHHTQKAPEDFWRRFRDSAFDRHLGMWKSVIVRWHNKELPYNISFHVPYEQLVNETTGPDLLRKLAGLFRDVGATVADDRDIACLWRWVVVDHASVKRKDRDYVPSFRREQKKRMLNVLDELIQRFPDQLDLIEILVAYKNDIEKNVPVDTKRLPKKSFNNTKKQPATSN